MSAVQNENELTNLFQMAIKSQNSGDTLLFDKCVSLLNKIAINSSGNSLKMDSIAAKYLFLAGQYETVIQLYERYAGRKHNLLPYLASSIFFKWEQLEKAHQAAMDIINPEHRVLRQKTVEMWAELNKPLEKEPLVHILLLTCNREEYVEEALRQIAATNYTNYSIFIADNGSTDTTIEKVQACLPLFPHSDRVHFLTFPTNIGRPAGHNWLLTAFDHSEADYIAIVDDDLVVVPPNWLTKMIQTIKAFPNCACVGGKSCTPGWPKSVHGGVRNITTYGNGSINLTNGSDQLDIGQFDFVDIVDHVIGCLHIFDRAALEKIGLFDIRFSPCQFVDIEHHIRTQMAGFTIVFNGLIEFEHYRAMGTLAARDSSLLGNSQGNVVKLLTKHDDADVHSMLEKRLQIRNEWLQMSDR